MAKQRTSGGLRVAIAVVSSLLALAVGMASGASTYSAYVITALGGSPYKITGTNGAKPISYARDNGMSLNAWKKQSDSLVQEVAGEGITLLKNDNAALPLAHGAKVTLFGRSSTDLVLGGTGAGTVDPTKAIDLKQAMEGEGFAVNPTLWNFYKKYSGKPGYIRSNGTFLGALPKDIHVAEPPVSDYTDAVKQSYGQYDDAAVVVLSRVGGEGSDMPTAKFGDGSQYMKLQDQEKALLRQIQQSGKFHKIIALINTSNAMELGWLQGREYGIDAALWVGGLGQSGSRAIARALDGAINPSGHLVDTYASNSFSSPAMQNFGDFTYTNAGKIVKQMNPAAMATKYVVYREGIYVGYRYYETRYADTVTDPKGTNAVSAAGASDGKAWNYDNEVVYPFGYGLSYGSSDGKPFDQRIVDSHADADGATATVQVTNTGKVAGKSVVQLYAQQPYVKKGIEKSAIQLVGFGKTGELKPGQSQSVTIKAKPADYASYDYQGAKTFVLDPGSYRFAVGDSAHDALNNVLAASGSSVSNGMDAPGVASKVFSWNNQSLIKLGKSYSGKSVTNRFDKASLEGYGKQAGYLTRADWNTFPKPYTGLEATDAMIANLNADGTYKPGSSDVSSVVTKQKNGLTFAQMSGAKFNDKRWNKLIDQMSADDLVTLVMRSGQVAVPSISYPALFMKDGPAGENVRKYLADGTTPTGYCSETVMASTFNHELARRVGKAMGEDWIRTGTSGAYAPAMNIHRTPYGGRNFEYYSEDGLMAGDMACETVEGLQSRGIVAFVKHFMMNEQETNRQGVSTFANEQSIRELYLKAFEKPFTQGHAKAAMGSFNRIGCTWAGAFSPLLKDVVRGEWGSTAIIDTDMAVIPPLQSIGAGLQNGNSMWATSATTFHDAALPKAKKDAKMLANLKEASHYILFNFANSIGVNGLSSTSRVVKVTPYWLVIAYVVIAVLALADVILAVFMVRKRFEASVTIIEKESEHEGK
ncbi:glycoside hydrolase family 3 protein [Bifidobacterium sp. ESL0745]|uniref:glycoside hydrolase family 3 protein n=1 Tax=Bifidobacterium sp. ESL0745 TaxID=2983226 RepID=UPI0023F944FE|nr:glycoside hydrolase family 3 protein [Bifidobacterium sp. ESL0745]MDF7666144.1 glycoside hydrolase family 3 C-terminal domain-containing protein [Bifidobacterium sp. ESL0745]